MGIIGKIVGKVALTVATPAIAILQIRLLDGIVCAIPTSASPRELARYQKTLDINMKKIDELHTSSLLTLSSLGKTKFELFELFKRFNAQLKSMNDLPERIPLKDRYRTNIFSIKGFSNYVDYIDNLERTDSLFPLVALKGFSNDSLVKDSKENYVDIFPSEKTIRNLKSDVEYDLDYLVSVTENMLKYYPLIINAAKRYEGFLKRCIARYIVVINNMDKLLMRSNDYIRIRRNVTSLYYSTMMLIDLCENEIIIDHSVNVEGLEYEYRKKYV